MLAPDGKLILTWRDHTQAPVGSRRFILVRGDADRILTCELEYSSSRVQVTDILHERGPQGWQLRTSTYHEVRLSLADVAREVEGVGLALHLHEEQRGWLTVVATPR